MVITTQLDKCITLINSSRICLMQKISHTNHHDFVLITRTSNHIQLFVFPWDQVSSNKNTIFGHGPYVYRESAQSTSLYTITSVFSLSLYINPSDIFLMNYNIWLIKFQCSMHELHHTKYKRDVRSSGGYRIQFAHQPSISLCGETKSISVTLVILY